MTNNFFILYNNSVYKNNYKFLFDNLSKVWQAKTSEKELESIIAPTVTFKIDIEDMIQKDIVYIEDYDCDGTETIYIKDNLVKQFI